MSEELEHKLEDADIVEMKADGEDSESADAVAPAGGAVKKRKADLKKTADAKADKVAEEVVEEEVSEETTFEKIFEGVDLSEEFKTKVEAVFEAVVHEKTTAVRAELEEKFEADLEEQVATATDELVEKIDSYLDYVAEQWLEKNEVAIESSLKVEVAESLFSSLKSLVVEHNIEISEDAVDRVAEIEEKLEEQEAKYNEVIESLISIKEEKADLERAITFADVSEGLTDTQAEKLKTLAEGITFESSDEYKAKLVAVKDNYFTESTVRTDETEFLEEAVEEEAATQKTEIADESMTRLAESMSRYIKK